MKPLEILGTLNAWGPVLFGLGFIAPLIAQTFEAAGIDAPLGLPPIAVGLALGTTAGLVAKRRGGWL